VDVNLDWIRAQADLPWEEEHDALFLRISGMKHLGSEPSFRAAGLYRYDAPDGSFETLYAAHSFRTCFYETVIRDKTTKDISESVLADRALLLLTIDVTQLRLVKLHGNGATKLRVDQSQLQNSDDRYPVTQQIAKVLHDHPSRPHGIVYRSRFNDDELALALFGRARDYVHLLRGTTPISLLEAGDLVGIACKQGGINVVRI